MPIDLTTRFVPIPGILQLVPTSPLGLLAPLVGTWTGTGFNEIFRPQQTSTGSDNLLELNLTTETLEFTEIPGEVPNRGFAQADLPLFGLTYLQQINDAVVKDTQGRPAGLHIEPGIWLNIQATTSPDRPATVARLANIPHGVSLTAQGTATVVSGPPQISPVDITPFVIGSPATHVPFPNETTLSTATAFRSPPSDIVGVTQAMVDNPNSVLTDALAGKTINSTTVLRVSTSAASAGFAEAGGGVSDIAFLDGAGDGNPNAQVVKMDATFWIFDFTDAQGSGSMLLYSQLVLLNFAGLSWPHVSVAALKKQSTKHLIKEKIEIKEHKELLKQEIKEFDGPIHRPPFPEQFARFDPGHAGPAAAAPAEGRHFIVPAERPFVGEPPAAPAAPAAPAVEHAQHADPQ